MKYYCKGNESWRKLSWILWKASRSVDKRNDDELFVGEMDI